MDQRLAELETARERLSHEQEGVGGDLQCASRAASAPGQAAAQVLAHEESEAKKSFSLDRDIFFRRLEHHAPRNEALLQVLQEINPALSAPARNQQMLDAPNAWRTLYTRASKIPVPKHQSYIA